MAGVPQSSPKETSQVWAVASIFFFSLAVAGLVVLKFLRSPQLFGLAVYVFPGTGAILGLIALTDAVSKVRFLRILAALAGLALNGGLLCCSYPLYDVYHQPSQQFACMANLKQMGSAKAAWAFEHHKTTNDIPADSDLFGSTAYILHKPECPGDGTYTIGKVGQRITCSIPGHSL